MVAGVEVGVMGLQAQATRIAGAPEDGGGGEQVPLLVMEVGMEVVMSSTEDNQLWL